MGYTTRLVCPMYEIAPYAGTSNIYLYHKELRSDTLVLKLKNKVLAAYSITTIMAKKNYPAIYEIQ